MTTLTLAFTPNSSADAAYCATFTGTYRRGRASDPAAGDPSPPPSFEGSECWLRPMVTSPSGTMCASVAEGETGATGFTATVYPGTCCVGGSIASLNGPADVYGWLLSDDGSVLVTQVHDPMIMNTEFATDPVLFRIIRSSGATELRFSAAFEGDPVIAAGASFGCEAHLAGSDLVVRSVGGAEHRHPL